MPMPHRTFAEVAKRRLVGKEGAERVATIRALLGDLPGYRNGPYADLRKWLEAEGVKNIGNVNDCLKPAHPWYEFYGAKSANELA